MAWRLVNAQGQLLPRSVCNRCKDNSLNSEESSVMYDELELPRKWSLAVSKFLSFVLPAVTYEMPHTWWSDSPIIRIEYLRETSIVTAVNHVRRCIQTFPDWPPGNGTALCH
jgi:hypothetical protein